MQVIQRGTTDQWDYVLRRLFVLKRTPLKDALVYVILWVEDDLLYAHVGVAPSPPVRVRW